MDEQYEFIENFLNLMKKDVQIQNCIAINFGYHKIISMPQIAMTLDSDNVDHLDQSSVNCFLVIISGQYVQMMKKIEERIDIISTKLKGKKPIAVFVMSNADFNNEKFPFPSSLLVS